jgi:hypothetical protein
MRTVHRLHAGNHVRAVRERDEPIALGFVVPALTDHLRLVEAPVMLESQRQRFVRDLVAQISNEDAMVVCRPAPPPPPVPPYTYTSSTSERVKCKLSHHSIGTHRAQGAAGCGLWSAFQITLYSNACGAIGETQSCCPWRAPSGHSSSDGSYHDSPAACLRFGTHARTQHKA